VFRPLHRKADSYVCLLYLILNHDEIIRKMIACGIDNLSAYLSKVSASAFSSSAAQQKRLEISPRLLIDCTFLTKIWADKISADLERENARSWYYTVELPPAVTRC